MSRDYRELQKTIGYSFKNPNLLKRALTHRSYTVERELDYDNQRLEFLGDAVIEILLSEHLFVRYQKLDEGELTKMRAALAQQDTLARLARELRYGDYIRLGKGETECRGGWRDSTLADAFEAVMGAMYIDGGIAAAKNFLEGLLAEHYPEPLNLLEHMNPKGDLQELAQKKRLAGPEYRVIEMTGPDHSPVYTVAVMVDGREMGRGSSARRKNAESEAAKAALAEFEKNQQQEKP